MNYPNEIVYRLFFENDPADPTSLTIRLEKRFIHDKYNVLELPDTKFLSSFRVSKVIFRSLLDDISSEFEEEYSKYIPLPIKLAIVLNYYASGSYEVPDGPARDTVDSSDLSATIIDITKVLYRTQCKKWIKYPEEEIEQEFKKKFYEKSGIPGIVGCVFGTHVNIVPPNDKKEVYLDKYGNHSLTVQLVCTYDLKICSVNAQYPGSFQNASIWRLSADRKKLLNDFHASNKNSRVLGDCTYPLEPWLLTPYRGEGNKNQLQFNLMHSKVRNSAVARCYGALKSSLKCILGEHRLRYKPDLAEQIIHVSCAIHNMGIEHKLPLPAIEPPGYPFHEANEEYAISYNKERFRAIKIRNKIMRNLLR